MDRAEPTCMAHRHSSPIDVNACMYGQPVTVCRVGCNGTGGLFVGISGFTLEGPPPCVAATKATAQHAVDLRISG